MADWSLPLKPDVIRKVPADSVPFGPETCTRGTHVWAAYVDAKLICIGATAKQARKRYYRVRLGDSYGRPPAPLPDGLDERKDRPRRV